MNIVIDDETAVYIRVAALAVAAHDYLITLPAEWRFYRAQGWRKTPSISCLLFIAIRYTSIALITVSSYSFFYHSFTDATCKYLSLAPAALKVVQIMASQAILGWRVYVVSQRSPVVAWFMFTFYVVSCAGEWTTSLLNRVYSVTGNCRSINVATIPTAWLYYLIAAIYDVVTTLVVVIYLIRLHPKTNLMTRLKKLLIYHGLGYFFALTVCNLLNILIYWSNGDDMQSAGVPIGYTLTWILSQKLLIHLNEISLREKAKSEASVESIIIVVSHTVEPSAVENSRVTHASYEGAKDSYDVDVNVRIRTNRRSIHNPPLDGWTTV